MSTEQKAKQEMMVDASSLSELLKGHGMIPNDYRDFEEDLEIFFARNQNVELYSLRKGMISFFKALEGTPDSATIGNLRSIFEGHVYAYKLKD